MLVETRRAAAYLAEYDISVEIINIHSVSHPNREMIIGSVAKTGKLLIADTSWQQYGVAAEVNRTINEFDPSLLKTPPKSLGMQFAPCPTAKALEDVYYADVHDIVRAVLELIGGNAINEVPLPQKQSMTDFYKHFKGPF